MKKYKYKIFSMKCDYSQIKTLEKQLNELGKDGWIFNGFFREAFLIMRKDILDESK